MMHFGRNFGIKYLGKYIIDIRRYLRNEVQSVWHDEFHCQRGEDVEVRIMSILHRHVMRRTQYVFRFLQVDITPRKMDVKRSWKPSTPLTMEVVVQN